MKRLFLLAALFLLFSQSVQAEISNPYVVDEKPQVLFGDSSATSTYQGLENYHYDYVGNYLHINFTYTHQRCCFAGYPPRIYLTATDPRATSTPEIKSSLAIFQLLPIPIPPGHETDWYVYDVQFDSTGYAAIVKEEGSTLIFENHTDVAELIDSDWAALANQYPIYHFLDEDITPYSMSFTPLQIYQEPQPPPVATTTPVIILPGIIGTKLSDSTGQEKWPDTVSMISSVNDSYLDYLNLNNSGEEIESVFPTSIIRNIGKKDLFSGLFISLEDSNLKENEDIFEFPYDWRVDVKDVAKELNEKIDETKKERGVEKVDLVAHSLGGLVVRKYLKEYGGDSINKFIEIGTPNAGAPKAFKILSYGDSFDVSFFFDLLNLNSERVKLISQNMPSVYELLPSKKYFNNYDYYVDDFSNNDKKLNFAQTSSYLKDSGRNSALVDRADKFHQEIDDLNPADYGVETYNIVGCGTPTIGEFYIMDNSPEHPIYNIKFINGDGTVPLKSAEAMPALKTYYVKEAKHALMPSTSGVKELVANLLTSTTSDFDLPPYSNLSMSSDGCEIPDGKIVSFHSPIELNVYDSSGNHTGPDINGDIEENIPGVSYEVIDGNKFAYLPNGTEYTIKGKATDVGTFDVRIQEVIGGEVVNTKVFADIPLSLTTKTEFTIGSNMPTEIPVDNNDDGVVDVKYPVTTTANGVLESTGKVVATQSVMQISEIHRAKSESVRMTEKIQESTTSLPQVLGVSTFTVTKPTEVQINGESSPKLKSSHSYQNTAIAYKTLGSKFKITFHRLWQWFKSKI